MPPGALSLTLARKRVGKSAIPFEGAHMGVTGARKLSSV